MSETVFISRNIATAVANVKDGLPSNEIGSVQFRYFTDEIIGRAVKGGKNTGISVVQIHKPFTKEEKKFSYNPQVAGGVDDKRMGTLLKDLACQTCSQTVTCEGHYGNILLKNPIVTPRKTSAKLIVDLLNTHCSCGRFYLDDKFFDEPERKSKKAAKETSLRDSIYQKFLLQPHSTRMSYLVSKILPKTKKLHTHNACKCKNLSHHGSCYENIPKYVISVGEGLSQFEKEKMSGVPSIYIAGEDKQNKLVYVKTIKTYLERIKQ